MIMIGRKSFKRLEGNINMPKKKAQKAETEPRKTKGRELGGIAFVGFFFLGFALAALYGRWEVAPFLALAMGFIAMFVAMLKG